MCILKMFYESPEQAQLKRGRKKGEVWYASELNTAIGKKTATSNKRL